MSEVKVHPGPGLLAGYAEGPSLPAHRARYQDIPKLDPYQIVDAVRAAAITGRGGAGFPFAVKLQNLLEVLANSKRFSKAPVVVVNAAEGEPASYKDVALVLGRPHLILDSAEIVARSLGLTEFHVVVSRRAPQTSVAMKRAIAERAVDLNIQLHVADDKFVAGQASAVMELMSGRPNLPVTVRHPEVFGGFQNRPTLLANAETWAQISWLLLVGAEGYRRIGATEVGTTLLTFDGERNPNVLEIPLGSSWRGLLPTDWPEPILVGGYHGAWTTKTELESIQVSPQQMKKLGLTLGAGAVLPLRNGECPVQMTSRIADYLARETANRCGPCLNGLPALADAVAELASAKQTFGIRGRMVAMTGLVTDRGACKHPDGTARMVRSLLTQFPDEIEAHELGNCLYRSRNE